MLYQPKNCKHSAINPIPPSQLPKIKMDLAGLSRYAKTKGVSLYELTETEIQKFIPTKLSM